MTYSNNGKIFCIGLSRTGTAALTRALKELNFKAKHWEYTKDTIDYNLNELVINYDMFIDFDAFTDIPIARSFRELDKKFPGSKYILTVRDVDAWLQSCENHFARLERSERVEKFDKLCFDLYGVADYDEEKLRQAYKKHLRQVQEFFVNRNKDLLVIDICAGEGWEKLCPFLGREIPKEGFPLVNVTRKPYNFLKLIKKIIKK